MGEVDRPEPLALAGLAPAQGAGGAHQPLEDLREVAGVQHDQAHALVDPLGDPVDGGVLDGAVRLVAPPERARRCPSAGRRAGRSRAGRGWRCAASMPCRCQRRGDGGVDALGVDRADEAFSRSWTNSFQTTARIMAGSLPPGAPLGAARGRVPGSGRGCKGCVECATNRSRTRAISGYAVVANRVSHVPLEVEAIVNALRSHKWTAIRKCSERCVISVNPTSWAARFHVHSKERGGSHVACGFASRAGI